MYNLFSITLTPRLLLSYMKKVFLQRREFHDCGLCSGITIVHSPEKIFSIFFFISLIFFPSLIYQIHKNYETFSKKKNSTTLDHKKKFSLRTHIFFILVFFSFFSFIFVKMDCCANLIIRYFYCSKHSPRNLIEKSIDSLPWIMCGFHYWEFE